MNVTLMMRYEMAACIITVLAIQICNSLDRYDGICHRLRLKCVCLRLNASSSKK